MSDRASAPVSDSAAWSAKSTNRAFSAFAVTLLVAGVVCAAMVAVWLPDEQQTSLFWIGPLLVVGFLLAEQLAINVDVRSGVAWTISFTEIPLVLGLLVAPFEVVLAAHVVAGVGTLLGRRILDRAVYNAGLMFMEISVAFAAAEAVNRIDRRRRAVLGGRVRRHDHRAAARQRARPVRVAAHGQVDARRQQPPSRAADAGRRAAEHLGRPRRLPDRLHHRVGRRTDHPGARGHRGHLPRLLRRCCANSATWRR